MSIASLLKAASITTEMIERRNALREIYGDKYEQVTQTSREIVEAISVQKSKSILEAALWICERAMRDGNGGAVNFVIAAAVDLCEAANAAKGNTHV